MRTRTVEKGGMEGGRGPRPGPGTVLYKDPREEHPARGPSRRKGPEVEPQHLWLQQTEQGEEREGSGRLRGARWRRQMTWVFQARRPEVSSQRQRESWGEVWLLSLRFP